MLKLSLYICALLAMAAPGHAQTRPAGQLLSPVFSSNVTAFQSFVRLWNDQNIFDTRVTIQIRNAQSGAVLGTWDTTVPRRASRQIAVSTIEQEAGIPAANRPDAYSFFIDMKDAPTLSGIRFQGVLWSPTTGYFQNASGCHDTRTSRTKAGNVHTTRIANYPSTLYITNDRNATKSVTITAYDAATGISVGSAEMGSIGPFATMIVPVDQLQLALGWAPSVTQLHLNVEVTLSSSGGIFDSSDYYKVQHLVRNGVDGSVVDMTIRCGAVLYAD
jgi:hypothetical protein